MPYQRILTMQDISCIGQCSMTVALPIISACGHEVCILPSAILSTHTGGFGKPVLCNLQLYLDSICSHWKQEEIAFDAIYIGYLGSLDAVRIASQIADEMLVPGGKLIVDPAMADHGKLYRGLSEAYANEMSKLCLRADVMLPNVTEAAMMTGIAYQEHFDESYVQDILTKLGGNNVVLTGTSFCLEKTGAAIRSNGKIQYYFHDRFDQNFHGTGDIFASVFTGAWMQGKTLEEAVQISADFTSKAIYNTIQNPAHWYGLKFETVLPYLMNMLK